MSDETLASAHHVGSIVAACSGGALLLAHPERYEHWAKTLGPERARLRLVDWLSRSGRFFRNIDSGIWKSSSSLSDLEMPLRGLLVQLSSWNGALPVPENATAAAQAALPLLGLARLDPNGFEMGEAPTIPTPIQASTALGSLEQDLVDEGSEARLLIETLAKEVGLDGVLLGYRSGETIACVGCVTSVGPTCAVTHAEADTTPLVADLLETSDCFFSLSIAAAHAAVRLAGAHAMLIATGPTRQHVEHLRAPGLGSTLDELLESIRFRVDRVSAPPTLTSEDDLIGS